MYSKEMQHKLHETLRNSLVPLKYPDTSIREPSTVGYAYLTADRDLAGFDPKLYNAVMFDQKVSAQTGGTRTNHQYSIPQIGEFCLQFQLPAAAHKAVFDINGVIVTSWEDLSAGKWYDLFTCPVNMFVSPYGQRFLSVEYCKMSECTVTFRYLSTCEKTRQDAIAAAISAVDVRE